MIKFTHFISQSFSLCTSMASVSARHFCHQQMYHNINSMGTITRAMSCSSRLVLIQDLREINQRINRASVWRWSHGRVIAK
ncbi:uncharacterized protein B0T23DRAFT_380843 [Neurospora hispaniola]|uniref:Uncharacterized protein n=1 Tax=Neurospora hispaniola TaxID=588809 RepID=A0AAJ0I8U5_9PEZI|nr:hypothetical protein B0T23DRAFT_380843 [Neurospora hispaniola]